MMRMGLGFWIVFLPFIFMAQGFGDEDSDFRGVRWGMGRIAVMASEKEVPEPVSGAYLSYRIWLLEGEVFLRYRFVENRLVEARYVFPVKSREDVNRFHGFLEKKYGKGALSSPGAPWDGFVGWETPRTRIRMELGGEGWARILYTGKEMVDWLEARHLLEKEMIQAEILDMF